MQKGFVPILVIISLVIVLIAGLMLPLPHYQSCGNFEDCPIGWKLTEPLWQRIFQSKSTTQVSEEKKKLVPPNQESTGVYTNSKFSFSINYPTSWLVEENKDKFFTYISPNTMAYDDLNPGKNLSINIRVFEEVERKRTAQELAQELNPNEETIDPKLSNIDAVIVKARKDRGPFSVGDGLFIASRDLEIVIGSRGVKSEEDEKLISEIFSSFKFTDNGETADWKTYTNNKYSYQVKYSNTAEVKEEKNANYDSTDFLLGCFVVYVGLKGFERRISEDKNGIPWNSLDELSNLKLNETKTSPLNERVTREDGSFIIKFTYKKLPPRHIGGVNWTALESTNNWENHSENNIYFTNRNNYSYLINMLSFGSCYEDEPLKMLETFKFLN